MCSSFRDGESALASSASDIVPLPPDGVRIMTTLATLLHISDLHFGPQATSAPAPALWQVHRLFLGLFGHHDRATKHLRRFVETTRAGVSAGQLFQLIVTGDLTSKGHDDEFDHVSRFLSDPAGLGEPGWRDYSVSGNHDQWGGRWWSPMAVPAPGLNTTFPAGFPQVTKPIPLAEGFSLLFVLLDTDADVGWNQRRQAQGHFLSQLGKADKEMPDHSNGEIRVVVLHHSRRWGHPAYSRPLQVLEQSRRALDQFMVSHGIAVALCGHTHCADVETYDAEDAGRRKRTVIHCCCGTTTTRDEFPYDWNTFPPWRLQPNMLLVHKITENGGKVQWQVTESIRSWKGFDTHREHGPFDLII